MNAPAQVQKTWRRWSRRTCPDAVMGAEASAEHLMPHAAAADDVLADLGVDPDLGLFEQEAQARLERDGPNLIHVEAPPTLLMLFLSAIQEHDRPVARRRGSYLARRRRREGRCRHPRHPDRERH